MKRTTDISAAVEHLKNHKLVAFPTETVYGLGGDGLDDKVVAAIYQAKGRPQFNPLIVHVASLEAAQELAEFNPTAGKLAKAFWPGPLTLVVPRRSQCRVSLLASAGLDSLAIRVPAHPVAQALLQRFAGPLVAPSANRSGAISPTSADHVVAGLNGKIDMVLDGGDCEVGVESTIVSCLGEQPVILRHGGVARKAIEALLGVKVKDGQGNAKAPVAPDAPDAPVAPVAPGQLQSHYAPKASVRLKVLEPAADEAFLGFGPLAIEPVLNLSTTGDVSEAAANLFKMLHQLDHQGYEKIAVSPIPDHGLGEAINDRLRRAAAPRESH